ncbi:MAG: MarR family transcriptional regulator, partial [Pseudomonadota bacterium]
MDQDHNLAILLDRFVRRVHVSLHRKAMEFDTAKVGPGGAILLLTLDEIGTVSMQDLARSLVRDKSQMTRAVHALEVKGMVTRQQSEDDNRVTLVSITDKGRGLVQAHQEALTGTLDHALKPLSDQEQSEFHRLLLKAVTNHTPEPHGATGAPKETVRSDEVVD